jgi:hypothetical protein
LFFLFGVLSMDERGQLPVVAFFFWLLSCTTIALLLNKPQLAQLAQLVAQSFACTDVERRRFPSGPASDSDSVKPGLPCIPLLVCIVIQAIILHYCRDAIDGAPPCGRDAPPPGAPLCRRLRVRHGLPDQVHLRGDPL